MGSSKSDNRSMEKPIGATDLTSPREAADWQRTGPAVDRQSPFAARGWAERGSGGLAAVGGGGSRSVLYETIGRLYPVVRIGYP